MNLDHELNKITCRFVECERETRIRQRGADTSSAPLFSSPRPRPWRMAGDAQHPHAPALPLRKEGDGRGRRKKRPPSTMAYVQHKAGGEERDAPAPS